MAVELKENPFELAETTPGLREHILLPEPEGVKCAELHFDFPSNPLSVDASPEEARAMLDAAKESGGSLTIPDPFFGEALYFPNDQLHHIMYIGCTWVPHEQLRAQALKNKIERGGRSKR